MSLTQGYQAPGRDAKGVCHPGQGCWGLLQPPTAHGHRQHDLQNRPHAEQCGPRGHCLALLHVSAATEELQCGHSWLPRAVGWSAPLHMSETRVLGREGQRPQVPRDNKELQVKGMMLAVVEGRDPELGLKPSSLPLRPSMPQPVLRARMLKR